MKDHGGGSLIVAAAVLLSVLSSDLQAAPNPSVCKNLPGKPAELNRTPRADTNLELLALALSDGLTADQAIYERLVRDVAGVRSMEARLKRVQYRPRYDGKTLVLRFSEAASALFAQGTYRYWDCANDRFGFESAVAIAPDLVKVRLKGIYDLEKIASVYARLPGVVSAEPDENAAHDDGATILVTREGDAWHYVFRTPRANAFYYFATGSHQSPKYQDAWTNRASASPVWLQKYWFRTQ